ncbi:hypothetical protein FRC01_000518 [Tulasnella sp. 417]|nr:hypothetical protein FRC01_000518 [Tulasnella sp. 417]
MWASSKSGILSSTFSLLKNAIESQGNSASQANEPIPLESCSLQKVIDENIEAMWIALHILRSQITQATRERNSLFPIAQLPPEITIEIFHTALDSREPIPGESSYYKRLQTIAAASTVWKSIVIQTPSFWTKVEISEEWKPFPLAISLRRAGDMPLDVSCTGEQLWEYPLRDQAESDDEAYDIREGEKCPHLKDLDDQLRAARDHLPRWRSFYLATGNKVAAQDLLSVQAFNIERVQASFGWEDAHEFWEKPVTLFGGRTGRLKEVIIEGVPLRWTSSRLAGLRVLDLKEIPYDRWKLSIPAILHTLKNCPELEELSLVRCEVKEVPEGQDLNVNNQTIELPKIQSIILDGVPPAANFILRSIRAPSLSLFHVFDGGLTGESLPISLTPHVRVIQQMMIAADTFHAFLKDQSVDIFAYCGETKTFQLGASLDQHEMHRMNEVMRWLGDNIPVPRVAASVKVTISDCAGWVDRFPEALYSWVPSATSLVLGERSQPETILPRLSEPVQSPGEGISWLWPNLESLSVTDPRSDGKEVLAFLRGRTQSPESEKSPRAKSSTFGDDGSIEMHTKPMKLSEVKLYVKNGEDDETLNAVRELVGK